MPGLCGAIRLQGVTANYLIWLLLKPSHLVLFPAVLGVVLWRRPLGRWCRRLAVVLLVVFGVLPTAHFVMRPLETRFAIPRDAVAVTVIIVLAGAELPVLTLLSTVSRN